VRRVKGSPLRDRAALALDRPTRRFGDGYESDGVGWHDWNALGEAHVFLTVACVYMREGNLLQAFLPRIPRSEISSSTTMVAN